MAGRLCVGRSWLWLRMLLHALPDLIPLLPAVMSPQLYATMSLEVQTTCPDPEYS